MDNFWTQKNYTPILDLDGWDFVKDDNDEEDSEMLFANVEEMTRRHGFKSFPLPSGCTLLVRADDDAHSQDPVPNDTQVSWLLVEFVAGNNYFKHRRFIASGTGFSGPLREARHTYFRHYSFYLNGKAVGEAFGVLGKWFDFN